MSPFIDTIVGCYRWLYKRRYGVASRCTEEQVYEAYTTFFSYGMRLNDLDRMVLDDMASYDISTTDRIFEMSFDMNSGEKHG